MLGHKLSSVVKAIMSSVHQSLCQSSRQQLQLYVIPVVRFDTYVIPVVCFDTITMLPRKQGANFQKQYWQ